MSQVKTFMASLVPSWDVTAAQCCRQHHDNRSWHQVDRLWLSEINFQLWFDCHASNVSRESNYHTHALHHALSAVWRGGTDSRVQHRSLLARLLQCSAVWSAVIVHQETTASIEQPRQSCLSVGRPYWRRTSAAVTLRTTSLTRRRCWHTRSWRHLCHPISEIWSTPARPLRSAAASQLSVPQTNWTRTMCFFCCGAICLELVNLLTDVRLCSNNDMFKRHLKTHLFRLTAYMPPSASVSLDCIGTVEILYYYYYYCYYLAVFPLSVCCMPANPGSAGKWLLGRHSSLVFVVQ